MLRPVIMAHGVLSEKKKNFMVTNPDPTWGHMILRINSADG